MRIAGFRGLTLTALPERDRGTSPTPMPRYVPGATAAAAAAAAVTASYVPKPTRTLNGGPNWTVRVATDRGSQRGDIAQIIRTPKMQHDLEDTHATERRYDPVSYTHLTLPTTPYV